MMKSVATLFQESRLEQALAATDFESDYTKDELLELLREANRDIARLKSVIKSMTEIEEETEDQIRNKLIDWLSSHKTLAVSLSSSRGIYTSSVLKALDPNLSRLLATTLVDYFEGKVPSASLNLWKSYL